MKFLSWKILIPLALLVPLLIWALFSYQLTWIHSVGLVDLTIEYTVVDASTDQAISAARIDFREDEGKPYPRGFIVADSMGHASHLFPDSTISRQYNGHTERNSIVLPPWSFSISAQGYKTSTWLNLYDYRRDTVWHRNGKATLTISVRLKKE